MCWFDDSCSVVVLLLFGLRLTCLLGVVLLFCVVRVAGFGLPLFGFVLFELFIGLDVCVAWCVGLSVCRVACLRLCCVVWFVFALLCLLCLMCAVFVICCFHCLFVF